MNLSQVCNKTLFCLKLVSLTATLDACNSNDSITELDDDIYISQSITKDNEKPIAVKLSYHLIALEKKHSPKDIFNPNYLKTVTYNEIDSAYNEVFYFNKLVKGLKQAIIKINVLDTVQVYFFKENFIVNNKKVLIPNSEALLYKLVINEFIHPLTLQSSDTSRMQTVSDYFQYDIRINQDNLTKLKLGDTSNVDIIHKDISDQTIYDSRLSNKSLKLTLSDNLIDIYKIPLLAATRKDSIYIKVKKNYSKNSMVLFGNNQFDQVKTIYIILK
jgi:hypothetical protein